MVRVSFRLGPRRSVRKGACFFRLRFSSAASFFRFSILVQTRNNMNPTSQPRPFEFRIQTSLISLVTLLIVSGAVLPAADTPSSAAAAPKPAPRAVAPAQWTTDYPAALAQAKLAHHKVLLLFTGSDWCIWCKRLENEILSTPAFAAYAQKDLVLVKLDFPHTIQQPPELVARNQKLQQQYGIEGYPTVIVLDSAGNTVGQLGYMQGGPGPFIEKLKAL